MMGYRRDREWSNRFIPTIKAIVGPHLLEPSNFEIDAKQATDFIVLMARDLRVAARVRSAGFAERYPHQFTIRSYRPSGALTELQKIVDGWGDWLFYGHAVDNNDILINLWMIVSLHAFRAALARRIIPPDMTGTINNKDGTRGQWFDVRGFGASRAPILIASSSAPQFVERIPAAAERAARQQLDLFL